MCMNARDVAGAGAVAGALAAICALIATGAALAAGASEVPFAEAFARARLVIVATVEAAPPAEPGFRLAVEQVVKGDAAGELTFPAEATSVSLVPGSRTVVLAMDPRSLDFRGTWTLAVAPDGSIAADGLEDAPSTVDELMAVYGEAALTDAGPAGTGPPPTGAGDAGGEGLQGSASGIDGAPSGSDEDLGRSQAVIGLAVAAVVVLGAVALVSAVAAGRRQRRP
jgi:hypothetical protein